MLAEIQSVIQQLPFEEGVATVFVTFRVFGPKLPDFLQVYATRSGDVSKAEVMEEVEFELPRFEYTVKLGLLAPSIYIIGVCPRTGRNDDPDEEIEGEHWTNFCRFNRYVTRAKGEEMAAGRPRPEITATETHPATFTRNNHIVIHFRAPRAYEWFFVRYRRPGQAEVQVEINVNGTMGVFTLEPTRPGEQYSFKVAGCDENSITGVKNCSSFTEPITVVAARNTDSLRAFLAGTDASGGLCRLMIAPPPLPPERSVRTFMHLR
jgi:hypothetical protein